MQKEYIKMLLKIALSILGVLFAATLSFAQSPTCAGLKEEKARVYGFHPSALNQEQRKQKSDEMDRFWRDIEQRHEEGVVCLREMLLDEKDDSFFLFDGSSLLLHLDQTKPSLEVIRKAASGTDLKDIDGAGYVRFLLRLSKLDVDIGPLAEKYLTYPQVDAYVPEHAMKLDRLHGAILLYGSMPPGQADPYLIAALGAKEDYVRSTAATVLAFDMTEESFKALGELAAKNALPAMGQKTVLSILKYSSLSPITSKLTREQVLAQLGRILKDDPDFPGVAGNEVLESSASRELSEPDLPLIREARRKSIRSVSDESLDEYFAMSKILLNLTNRLDLYKAYRIH